jgi:soluble lytic murein transglycosylase-like protein
MFDAGAIGDRGRAQGLMQVQERWHFDRMSELGVTDLLDPYQNVTVGIHFLEELIWLGDGSIEWALMAYNGGHGLANQKAESVVEYAEIVMSWAEEMTYDG